MGKGLSPLQLRVLRTLEENEEVTGNLITGTPSDFMRALDLEPTRSNRVAMSKSLKRLVERGLLDWQWVGHDRKIYGLAATIALMGGHCERPCMSLLESCRMAGISYSRGKRARLIGLHAPELEAEVCAKRMSMSVAAQIAAYRRDNG